MLDVLVSHSNAIGIVGVSFILTAYYLNNTNKLTVLNLKYQLLNFFGSWLILFSLLFHWNLASVIIEVAWITISIIGIVRSVKSATKTKQEKMNAANAVLQAINSN